MARKSAAKNEAPETHGLLPVPEPVIRHHQATLAGAMREWAQQNRVPPVLLFTGTAGCGKRNIAYWIAQWILCERSGFVKAAPQEEEASLDMFGGGGGGLFGDAMPAAPQNEITKNPNEAPAPCGECASCQRAIKGNWVDFTEVLPEDSDEETGASGTLKVDQFRKIKASLGFGAHEGAYRIVLIPNADRMTVQAANSVLKLLEEPPPGWIFFLTASDPTLVLPTILSRCQSLRLKPFQPSELKELLELAGAPSDRRDICAQLAQGSWSKAVALCDDETWERRDTLFEFIREPASQLSALVDWASQAPKHFDSLVDQLEQMTSELILWSVSAQAPESYPWVSADGKKALCHQANTTTKKQGGPAKAREFWIARAQRLAEVRQEALAPLNRKLLVQEMLLPWLQGTSSK